MELEVKLRTGILLLILTVSAIVFYKYRIDVADPEQMADMPNSVSLSSIDQPSVVNSADELSAELFPNRIINQDGSLGHFTGILEKICATWADDLGIDLQIVVANLDNTSLNEFSTNLFQRREIGANHLNGGLLLVLNSGLKEAHIEVSYDLEYAYPDALLGRLASDQLAPYAASKMAGMAITDTVRYLKDIAFIQAEAGNLTKPEIITENDEFKQKLAYLSGGAGATINFDELNTAISISTPLSKQRAKAYAPGKTPEATVAALKRAWADLVPHPDLALYTPASHIINSRYPYAPFEVAERLRRFEQSGEKHAIVQGEYAVITSDSPAVGFTPILLKKIGDYWRVDLAETWKNLFYDEEGNYYQKNNNHPYAFGLGQFGAGSNYPIQALELNGRPLLDVIAALESRDDALSHYELAELLFRNSFAAMSSLIHYEKAVELAPYDPLFRSALADRYIYLGFTELAIPHLRQLGEVANVRLAQAYALSGNYVESESTAQQILARNPYSYHGTAWLDYALSMQNNNNVETSNKLQKLLSDPHQKMRYVRLGFAPEVPVFDNNSSIDVNGTTVFGHSEFSVVMTNFSERPIMIESVQLTSMGTDLASGLGDIKDYWSYADSERTLQPGQALNFEKTWGFTVKTGHQRLSYLFKICWRGVGEAVKQCESQLLHLTSTSSEISTI